MWLIMSSSSFVQYSIVLELECVLLVSRCKEGSGFLSGCQFIF